MTTDRPGLLVYNASEVATLAGGLRRGAAQADIGLLTAEGGRSEDAPAVAAYQGRIVAAGRLPEVEARLAGLGVAEGAIERVDARRGTVTLIYSSHDTEHNNAVALQEYLQAKRRRKAAG